MDGKLFSQDFLLDGIRSTPVWEALPDDALNIFISNLKRTYAPLTAESQLNEANTEADIIEAVLGLLGWNGLTQPRRQAMRQQCVSTGKTCLPSEYIKTQRATFLPTPGSDNKKASASSSLILCNGFRVGSPNSAMITSKRLRIALAFWLDKPPLTIGRAIYSAGASAIW